VQVIFFPEASDYICSDRAQCQRLCKPTNESEFVKGLQEEAAQHKISVSVGIHVPGSGSVTFRAKNSLIWINEEGEITESYDKVHMLEMDIPGGPKICESDFCEPGKSILPPFDSPVGKIGAMICYDLRFPSLAQTLVSLGADVLIYPSAFVPATGQFHWIPLLQARAIECQAYVIASDQVGVHNKSRSSYGHSVVIDPWGSVVAQLENQEDVVMFADVNSELVRTVRQSLPLHKRE
jgi:predicted amidohydrolase